MRNLLIAALISLTSLGAQAQSKPHLSDIANQLTSNEETYVTGFLAGVVMMELGNAQVCGGRTVVGAAEAQMSADIKNYLEKYPDRDVSVEYTDIPTVTLGLLKNDYPCLK